MACCVCLWPFGGEKRKNKSKMNENSNFVPTGVHGACLLYLTASVYPLRANQLMSLWGVMVWRLGPSPPNNQGFSGVLCNSASSLAHWLSGGKHWRLGTNKHASRTPVGTKLKLSFIFWLIFPFLTTKWSKANTASHLHRGLQTIHARTEVRDSGLKTVDSSMPGSLTQ